VTELSHPYLKRWLAISRTRIFVAVTVPSLIGSAIALRHGHFALEPFTLMLFGLVMLESANLLMADWATYRSASSLREQLPPIIEGSPMIPERLLPLRYSLHAAILCFALAALTFVYFAAHLGFLLLILGALALVIGFFYVLSPIRYAFFSTALLPGVIAFGSYYVLVGLTSWEPALATIPMMLLSSGVIFTYRILYSDQDTAQFRLRKRLLIGIYVFAYLALAGVVLGGLTPLPMILGFASLPILIAITGAINRKTANYLPATSLGVLLYATTGILIALSYVLF
jgi:1,4-dihydroxy-2-naphthoate octaprenyltransferase